jgi:hypothetical protein
MGAIHGNDPTVEVVNRSRASYGIGLDSTFVDGDPEWSRYEDPFDNIDRCSGGVCWEVRKVSKKFFCFWRAI